jgi:CRISPR-associated protein Csm3
MPVSITQKPLLGKVRITSTLNVETGLHIGGGGESLDIGGLDKPVIRDPLTQHPYLPGSSIKGKLRSILERLENKPVNRPGGSGTYRYESDDLVDGFTEVKQGHGKPPLLIFYDGAQICKVCRVFGSTGVDCWVKSDAVEVEQLEAVKDTSKRRIAKANDGSRLGAFVEESAGEIGELYTKVKGRNSTARLIVRDCHLQRESAEKLERVNTGLYMTEWKFENGIDRITAAANPRQVERVPAGSKFQFELIYTVEDSSQAVEDLQNLAIALALLEDDALGGHGSRGYGKVKFADFQFSFRSLNQYRQIASGESGLQSISPVANTEALLENFGRFRQEIERRLPPENGSEV